MCVFLCIASLYVVNQIQASSSLNKVANHKHKVLRFNKLTRINLTSPQIMEKIGMKEFTSEHITSILMEERTEILILDFLIHVSYISTRLVGGV